MLSEGVSDRRGRSAAHLHRDRVNGRIKARRGARLAAITSGGAIPDNANYQVVLYPDETRIGEVDEDFAIDSSAGDVFLLGNASWRIRRIEAGRVMVEDARGASPTVPFWFGEAPARTIELSQEVSALRSEVEARIVKGCSRAEMVEWASAEMSMPRALAEQLVAYLAAARAALGTLPTSTKIIAERFFDEGGGMQLVIHSPLGGRINRGWGLALRKRFCRGFNFELQAAATDDGIVISLGQPHSFPLESVFQFLSSKTVEEILIQALLDAPMFEIRWRWNVTRSLVLLRRHGGKKIAPHLLRMRADDLLSVVFPQAQACLETIVGDREVPDHPLVKETVRDCLIEAMDIGRLRALIQGIEDGSIEVLGKDTVEPSPLSHELINANPYAFLDDAPLEERRTRAVNLRRGLKEMGDDIGVLDAQAIASAEDEARPAVRDRDELHDALLSLYVLPEAVAERMSDHVSAWHAWFEELVRDGRATRLCYAHHERSYVAWVAAERLPLARAAFAAAVMQPELPPLPFAIDVPEPEAVDIKIVSAHLDSSGPRTGRELAGALGMPGDRVLAALYALESDGAILRGQFRQAASKAASTRAAGEPGADVDHDLDIEWCNRRILARIHRLTLARLRSEVEPVTAAALMRFLLRWQRVAAGNQVIGADGLCSVIEQLQGFESAAGAWEQEILPARLHDYDPGWLDMLCLSGQVAWCRLSPRRRGDLAVKGGEESAHDADSTAESAVGSAEEGKKPGSRSAPTKAAPLAIMLRRDLAWLRAPAGRAGGEAGDELAQDGGPGDGLGATARTVYEHLHRRGASFLAEIASATGREPAEVEDGLWELVAAGLATADGFASMRVLVDRHRGESRSVWDQHRRKNEPSRSRKWRDAVSNARRRERYRPAHAVRSLPTAAGRWSLLGPPDAEAMDSEAAARQLLCRYGVVFRDLLARESSLPPWRELLIALRRLEARGEIRGGRFVAGFVGEQFALPEAVEGLRAMRKTPPIAELVRVAATDPLNLVGVTSAGPKVPAVIGNAVLYRDGVALASVEAGEVVVRANLEEGARIDRDLAYHPPPRRDLPPSPQVSLPFG
jgi:ATP-dependent helicase Lhr and Lhr-like helicase